MQITRKRAASVGVAAFAAVALLPVIPSVAMAGDPPYPANCSGGQGDLNAHRYTRYNHTVMRKYNSYRSKRVAVLKKNKKLHLFYKTTDNHGVGMYAARFWLKGHAKCGYIYQGRVNWRKTW